MHDLQILGDILSERRISRGLTQQDIADTAGIQRTYISDIERGRRNVTVFVLARIASALNMSLGQLFKQVELRLLRQSDKKKKTQN